ncbi:hypothetical protein AM233_09395 [Bacillus sp. FJAT-22058]|nr:hypothetical protein AM233_09395 [Bacillus sp. FJAT-22058]
MGVTNLVHPIEIQDLFYSSLFSLFLMYLLLNEQEINTLKIILILITSLSFLKSAQGKKG